MNKILILHASAGHGHEKCAHAVAKAFGQDYPLADAKVYDALTFTPTFCGRFYRESYLFLIKRMPFLWAMLYNFHDFALLSALIWPLRRAFNHCMTQKLVKYIRNEQPDAIICTHFMPTEIVGNLKSKNHYSGLLMTVITDFMPHYFWLRPQVDYFIAGLPDTAAELQRRGIPQSKIIENGIPVDPAFQLSEDHRAAKEKMGLNPDLFTVLLTGGGAGVGAVEQLCGQLCASQTMQVVVITGTNKVLKERLEKDFAHFPCIKIQGFVDNMHEWIDASDIMIGKGGGLTVSETLAMGRPMILINPVPGQEMHNARQIVEHGAGMLARSPEDAAQKIQMLMNDPDLLAQFKNNASRIGKRNAASDLARFTARAIESKLRQTSEIRPKLFSRLQAMISNA